jgi:hypothetical protein
MTLLQMLNGVKGAQFASLTYRTKATDELARYTLLLGASVENAYAGDIQKVEDALPTLTEPLEIEAAREILLSLRQSLDKGIGNNDAYTLQGVYTPTGIKGVYINTNDNILHIKNVFVQSKVVLQEGAPRKPVKSKPLTIAKDRLKKALGLRSNKLRQFVLDNITKAVVNGDTIIFE